MSRKIFVVNIERGEAINARNFGSWNTLDIMKEQREKREIFCSPGRPFSLFLYYNKNFLKSQVPVAHGVPVGFPRDNRTYASTGRPPSGFGKNLAHMESR
jgi:hypothetical protein